MPWRTASVETARARFVVEAEISDLSHAELCRGHSISRPTGYKWLQRYEAEELEGLKDRSHRPGTCPHATSDFVVQRVLELRKHRSHQRDVWGARKIRRLLEDDPSIETVPSPDTIHRILVRHDCIEPRKPRRRREHTGPPLPIPPEPNSTWTADFKGEFRTADRKPLLPPHCAGRPLPLPVRLPGNAAPRSRGYSAPLPPALPGVRSAAADPHRQRPPLCLSRHRRALEALDLLDLDRRPARAHRTRQAATEWPARTHAPDPQAQDGFTSGRFATRPAARVQSIPSSL